MRTSKLLGGALALTMAALGGPALAEYPRATVEARVYAAMTQAEELKVLELRMEVHLDQHGFESSPSA